MSGSVSRDFQPLLKETRSPYHQRIWDSFEGLVDELMLSIFEQRILPEDQIVGALPPPDFLRSHFGLQVAEYSQMQGEGLWRFRRYRRETRG